MRLEAGRGTLGATPKSYWESAGQLFVPYPHFPGLFGLRRQARNDNHLQQGSAEANCCRRNAFRWFRIVSGPCLVVQGMVVAGRAAPAVFVAADQSLLSRRWCFGGLRQNGRFPALSVRATANFRPDILLDIRPFLLSRASSLLRVPDPPNDALESVTDVLKRTKILPLGRKR